MKLFRRVFGSAPTVFHVTHHKAGSQWIYGILKALYPEYTVQPLQKSGHVLDRPIERGRIYPTVYLEAPRLDTIALPRGSRIFVIVRDLRDTLISLYFSLKVSHPVLNPEIVKARECLENTDKEQGLIMLIRGEGSRALQLAARIQRTWAGRDELVLKYEELVADNMGCMMHLLSHCRLPVDEKRLEGIVEGYSFEKQTGRQRGVEDVFSHLRKGMAGDWRNHFTPKVRAEFKKYYSDILVENGYEQDENWQ